MLARPSVTAGLMCAPLEIYHSVNGHGHGKAPAGGDDNPARVVPTGFFQVDISAHASAQQNEQESADQFRSEFTHAAECSGRVADEKERMRSRRLVSLAHDIHRAADGFKFATDADGFIVVVAGERSKALLFQ